MHSRISADERREPTCVRFGPMAPPSLPTLWQPVQPAPRMIVMGSVLPPAIPGPELLAAGDAGAFAGGMSDAVTSTVPPCDSRNATSAQICCGERIRPISGMIGSYPDTTNARGLVSDS